MSSEANRREFTRLPLNMHVTLAAGERTLFCPETDGVSLRGLYAFSADPLPLGTVCGVLLQFGGVCGLTLELEGRVANVDAAGMGIEFTALSIEALHHMQQLLLYNADDPGTIEREFREHVGLKRPPR